MQYKAAHNLVSASKGKESTSTGPNSKQLTLEESADKFKKWDINDVRFYRKIGENDSNR